MRGQLTNLIVKAEDSMRFRPCIDIHNGKVKQIVGGSLKDAGDFAKENFVSEFDAAKYASLYKSLDLYGGHVILLNSKDSPYYEDTKREAVSALSEFPGGLMVGGGINAANASEFIEAGASHVVVTSYIFEDGNLSFERIKNMTDAVGAKHLVIDLSCREKNGRFYVVTDRWQTFTDEELTPELLDRLSEYCDEFLIHAVDAEGKKQGVSEAVLKIMADSKKPVTYAGGVSSFDDIKTIKEIGEGKIDFTIGSALDLFGGDMDFDEVLRYTKDY